MMMPPEQGYTVRLNEKQRQTILRSLKMSISLSISRVKEREFEDALNQIITCCQPSQEKT